jgi:hypothetical protein
MCTAHKQDENYTVEKPLLNAFDDISKIRNREDKNITFYTDLDKTTQDFYWRYDRGLEKVDTQKTYISAKETYENISDKEKVNFKNLTAYQIDFANKGGLVMPIILEFTFDDGTKLYDKKSAQIWRKDENKVSLTYYLNKKLKSIHLDPMRETADINEENNVWGDAAANVSKFQIFKQKEGRTSRRGGASGRINPMQAAGK